MFLFYLISFHYIRLDYVLIDLIQFDLPDFWLGLIFWYKPRLTYSHVSNWGSPKGKRDNTTHRRVTWGHVTESLSLVTVGSAPAAIHHSSWRGLHWFPHWMLLCEREIVLITETLSCEDMPTRRAHQSAFIRHVRDWEPERRSRLRFWPAGPTWWKALWSYLRMALKMVSLILCTRRKNARS